MTDRLIWAHGAQEMVRIGSSKVSKGHRVGASFNPPRVVRREAGVTFSERGNSLIGIGGKAPQSEEVDKRPKWLSLSRAVGVSEMC